MREIKVFIKNIDTAILKSRFILDLNRSDLNDFVEFFNRIPENPALFKLNFSNQDLDISPDSKLEEFIDWFNQVNLNNCEITYEHKLQSTPSEIKSIFYKNVCENDLFSCLFSRIKIFSAINS